MLIIGRQGNGIDEEIKTEGCEREGDIGGLRKIKITFFFFWVILAHICFQYKETKKKREFQASSTRQIKVRATDFTLVNEQEIH